MHGDHPWDSGFRRRAGLQARTALLLAAIAIALTASRAAGQVELYVKGESLQQTLLAARARFQRWRTAQRDAQRFVKVGPWHGVALDGGEQLDGVAATLNDIAPAPQPANGNPRWTRCRADQDGHPVLTGSTADFLFTTIRAERPVEVSIELSRHERFGGYAYRPSPSGAGVRPSDSLVWLNGRRLDLHDKLAPYCRTPVAKRRGWHDAVLIDLPLARGENRLLLSLRKNSQKSWFNSVRFGSDPVPVLWSMVENDFPRSRHRLLEHIHYSWFDSSSGWFSQSGEAQLEKQEIRRRLEELGQDGEPIRRRLDELLAAGEPSSSIRWLDLCVTAAELSASLRDAGALEAAVTELYRAYPHDYPGPSLLSRVRDLRQRLLAKAADRLDPTDKASDLLFRELRELQHEALAAKNPLLAGKRLLLVKRPTYDSNHYYDEFNEGIRRFGGDLCLLSLEDGRVQEMAPQLAGGLFDRYDLSFDARRIVFNYKPCKPGGFRLYEIGADGAGLRQLTFPPADEYQRIAAYSIPSREQLEQNPCLYGHWTDDMHPCYLPDGRIVFTSTRSERSVLCGGHALTVSNLYRINADGTGLHQLSQGALSEFCPSVMNDGRMLYNRWEYVDKGAGAVQSLWAMCPDGSRSEEIYGNNIPTPPVFNQARHVPGRNNLVACLGAGHCPGNMGAILLVDLHKNKRSEEAMTALTPTCLPKGNWGMRQYRNGRWIVDVYGPWYCDPFPLSDPANDGVAGKFFLVSCNPDQLWNEPSAYGVHLLDIFGNRTLLYDDPEISCWQARPLEPRRRPPALPDSPRRTDPAGARDATLLLTDVHQGLDGVPPGEVKYLRVMEQAPRPWSVQIGYQPDDRAPGQMAAVSLYTHLSVKVLHGVVPVCQDGSAYFTVPADRNIFLQALDENFMEIQRMRTFVNFQPGERRSCIGCHERRSRAPANRRPIALESPPVAPQPQPGEIAPRPLYYPSDVQPIFDRHCVSCHSGQKPDGGLDLTGGLTELFCRSYENIIRKDLVCYIQEFMGPKEEGADAMGYAPAAPPYTYGSHKSKLIQVLRQGHYEVKLSRDEFIKLATWVDSNSPYYGSYFGRRNIAHRNSPDFRPQPTLQSAQGIRPPS